LASVVWEPLIPKDAITIFSGGTEGVLSPHVTFIVRESSNGVQHNTGLVAAVTRTRAFEPAEIGTRVQAAEVAKEVEALLGGPDFREPSLVLIKCPLLTTAKIDGIKSQGKVPLTTDTYESMALSRYASAVGVAAVSKGDGDAYRVDPSVLNCLDDEKANPIWSEYASCSSGAELEDCHILVLGTSRTSGNIRTISSVMNDAIDAKSITDALSVIRGEQGQVLQVFAKAEADPSGTIRGKRHTMSTDSDIHGTRHARAAVGGLIAGLTGDTQIYVSGGAEGQGPPGGGSLCIVYRVP
jgi:cyanuric acid amidohydrolase